MGRMCVLRGYSLTTVGERKEEKKQTRADADFSGLSSRSFINSPGIGGRIRSERKGSSYPPLICMVSPQVNKKNPAFDTKPYYVITPTLVSPINISCHSLIQPLPRCASMLSPLSRHSLPLFLPPAPFTSPASLLFHRQSFGIGANKIFISGK